MAIDFPNTPTVGQTFTSNGRTWQYTSAGVWDSLAANTSPGNFSVDGSFTADESNPEFVAFIAANPDALKKAKPVKPADPAA